MITTINYKGHEIRFEVTNPGDHLQKYWLKGHFYEERMLHFIQKFRMYKQPPVVVDVGACIGNHTIFFARVMSANVYAFEPVRENMDHIKRNALLNVVMKQITFIPHGAGDSRSMVKFKKGPDGNCGMGRISLDGSDTVNLVPIDEVISQSHEVDILKIDVEGYNIPVLEGARYTIEHDHPEIYIEAGTDPELQEVKDFLLPLGYTFYPKPFNATPTWFFYT